MTKAVLTVIGQDRVGIIAAVSRMLADAQVNILDISQTTMQDIFTMTMLVDVTAITGTAEADRFRQLSEALEALGESMNLKIQLRHVDIFNAMHKI